MALRIAELSLVAGRVYAIVGPNGAGKTTLLKLLALLERPSAGRLLFCGEECWERRRRLWQLRRRVTLVEQHPLLFDTTVARNVDYGLRVRGVPRAVRRERVAQCLSLVGLAGFENRRARALSGGEAQRVAVARAAALRPEVMLLDEPTSNVDEPSVAFMEELLRSLNELYGTTVVFATHDLTRAYRVADEVVGLAAGELADLGTENLFAGELKWHGEGCWFDTGKIQVAVLPPAAGVARHMSIAAEEIVLSRAPIVTSARNRFVGRITGLQEEKHTVAVSVDVGEVLRVRITKLSFQEMRLAVGSTVHLAFKTSSVRLF